MAQESKVLLAIGQMNIDVIQADYANEQHREEIPMLLDEYASDPMGGGIPLNEDVRSKLVTELSKIPHAFSLIAYADDQPAGLTNCFEAFSTFSCRPLINIHDIVVRKKFRGHGISQAMLGKVEAIARSRNCCKMTMEVLSKNEVAKSAYRRFGFAAYTLDPGAGAALFWQKTIESTEPEN